MEWVHCNKCFRKINNNLKYFMKECGRIECQKCLQPTGMYVCADHCLLPWYVDMRICNFLLCDKLSKHFRFKNYR